ncbi:MAG: signal peptidase II [Trueperaceae bacterium]
MYLLLAGLLIAADQASKWWATNSFSGGGALELGLAFRLIYIRNTGAAFGLLRDLNLRLGPVVVDGTLLLGLLSAAVSLMLLWYLMRRGSSIPALPRFALTLVLAGAAGNMIDRLLWGFVIDFIHFRSGSFDFPVFNLADSFVVVGGALLFLSSLIEDRFKKSERRTLAEPEFFGRLDHNDRP